MKNSLVKISLPFLCMLAMAGCDRTSHDSALWMSMGNHALKTGKYDEALTDFNAALKYAWTDAEKAVIYYNRGLVYYDTQKYDEAIADFSAAIAINPGDVEAHLSRGVALGMQHQYEKSLEDLGEVIKLDPQKTDGYFDRGITYALMKEQDKALADFNAALQLDPYNKKAIGSRAEVLQAKGDYAGAIADNVEAIRIDPKMEDPVNNLAWLLATCPQAELRDGKKAVVYAQQACELTGWKHANCIDTLAAAYAESGDFDNAVKYEQQYLAWPDLPEKTTTDGQARLALYQAHTAYHQEKKQQPQ